MYGIILLDNMALYLRRPMEMPEKEGLNCVYVQGRRLPYFIVWVYVKFNCRVVSPTS